VIRITFRDHLGAEMFERTWKYIPRIGDSVSLGGRECAGRVLNVLYGEDPDAQQTVTVILAVLDDHPKPR